MSADLAAVSQQLGITDAMLAGRDLQVYPQATQQLVLADTQVNGSAFLLIPAAAVAWQAMKAAAADDAVAIFLISAFRSIERQAEIIQGKLKAGMRIQDVLSVLAPPGFSEHHTGRAVDISTPGVRLLQADFEHTNAFAWLQSHAKQFGFYLSYPKGNSQGYQYEPWHWCFQRF